MGLDEIKSGFEGFTRKFTGVPPEEAKNSYDRMRETKDALYKELQDLDTFLASTDTISRLMQGEIREEISEGTRQLENLTTLLGDPLVKEHFLEDKTEGVVHWSGIGRDPRTKSLEETTRAANVALERVRQLNAERGKYRGA